MKYSSGSRPSRKFAFNGKVDRLAGHVRHQATHAAELTQLGLRTTGAGVGHHVERVLLVEHVEHERCNLIGTSGPLVNDFDVALRLVDEALLEVLVDLVDVGLGRGRAAPASRQG